MQYQNDFSKTFNEICDSDKIKGKVYEKYGITASIKFESINEYNSMYCLELDCEKLDKNTCIEAHNMFSKEFIQTVKNIYSFDIKVVDSAYIIKE